MKTPKTASGKTISNSGFIAPRVQEGTYKAIVTKGKETYTHTFKVLNDPKSAISASDRLKQKETTTVLFNMNEELAYTVYQIDETVKLINLLIEKNKSFSKEGLKIKTAYETLKAKMVITTGDDYVGSAEKQLREKLGELYATVASNFTAPSSSQLENMEAIRERFDNSMKEFKTLKAKNESLIQKQVVATGIPFVLKTFGEFTAD